MFEFFERNAEYGPLVLRFFFGIAFLVAGLDKILNLSMAKGMFEGMFGGAGAVMLYLAIAIELVGGLMLLFGRYIRESALVLSAMIVVALFMTWKLGDAASMVSLAREALVMNTGGGNTAVNFAYLAGLISLAFSAPKSKKRR